LIPLKQEKDRRGNNMLFKIFSILYLFLYLFTNFNPRFIKLLGWQEWLTIGNTLIGILGMISYAFKIKIFNKLFWQYFLFIFIGIEITYMVWLGKPLIEKANVKEMVWLNNAINIILELPIVYVLFRLQQKWESLYTRQRIEEK
jgi:hypothetical protein